MVTNIAGVAVNLNDTVKYFSDNLLTITIISAILTLMCLLIMHNCKKEMIHKIEECNKKTIREYKRKKKIIEKNGCTIEPNTKKIIEKTKNKNDWIVYYEKAATDNNSDVNKTENADNQVYDQNEKMDKMKSSDDADDFIILSIFAVLVIRCCIVSVCLTVAFYALCLIAEIIHMINVAIIGENVSSLIPNLWSFSVFFKLIACNIVFGVPAYMSCFVILPFRKATKKAVEYKRKDVKELTGILENEVKLSNKKRLERDLKEQFDEAENSIKEITSQYYANNSPDTEATLKIIEEIRLEKLSIENI